MWFTSQLKMVMVDPRTGRVSGNGLFESHCNASNRVFAHANGWLIHGTGMVRLLFSFNLLRWGMSNMLSNLFWFLLKRLNAQGNGPNSAYNL